MYTQESLGDIKLSTTARARMYVVVLAARKTKLPAAVDYTIDLLFKSTHNAHNLDIKIIFFLTL